MLRIISTKLNGKSVSILTDDFDIKEFRISEEDTDQKGFHIGDIIIGRVTNVVKNINSCFVEISPGIQGYLNLKEEMNLIYTNGKPGGRPVANDLILVQIMKEPTKTKSYTLTTEFTFMNKYVILKPDMKSIHISARYRTEGNYREIKARFTKIGKKFLAETGAGFIVRKAAMSLSDEAFENLLYDLYTSFLSILHRGKHGVQYERIFRDISPHLALLRDNSEQIEKIMTDDPELYEEYNAYLAKYCAGELDKLYFYKDDMMSLSNLYSIRSTLEKCLSKNVWLNSGAYIVIEPTEALTVIDVNTGKAIAGKHLKDETFMKINLEAAREIANQIRLRNLSGIIVIDFIDVPVKYNKLLIDEMSAFLKEDSTNAYVVDITGLGLMEITRRRTGRPLHEYQLKTTLN